MTFEDLLNRLEEHRSWAIGNEWETPLTLADDIGRAIATIEELLQILFEVNWKMDSIEERLDSLEMLQNMKHDAQK